MESESTEDLISQAASEWITYGSRGIDPKERMDAHNRAKKIELEIASRYKTMSFHDLAEMNHKVRMIPYTRGLDGWKREVEIDAIRLAVHTRKEAAAERAKELLKEERISMQLRNSEELLQPIRRELYFLQGVMYG